MSKQNNFMGNEAATVVAEKRDENIDAGYKGIVIIKRDGRVEPMTLAKYQKVINWAAQGLDVSVSQIEILAERQLSQRMTTDQLHQIITKVCADQISAETPDYQFMAARMAMFRLRKIAYGSYQPPSLYDHVNNMVEMGKYDKHILEDYTPEELHKLDDAIDHDRDNNLAYAAVKQMEGKYLVQNRVTGDIYESAQMLYMMVAACLFAAYPKKERLDYVIRFYDACSTFKLSLPTPIMAGVRTPTRQFSSCVLIESGDSLDSINASASAIVKYVSQRAGIGLNAGRIRAIGSEIRGGEAFHTGCIPFYKYFQTAVKSCSQGGVRGGAATVFYPIWHYELPELLVLKNNRGVEENRVRHLDYGVQISKLFYERYMKNGVISLFSPSDVPGMYDAFFEDQELFEKLYTEAEKNPLIRRREISAKDAFHDCMSERAGTGRIYIQNIDHCNTHSPFNPKKAPIRQSNLCLEIALPTKPLEHVNDPNGEIALCTLSAFNLGAIDSISELEELAELAVRALDSLLDYQDYPLPAAERSSLERRTLGVGVINFANYLAKHGVRYSDGSAKGLVHKTFEAIQFYLMKASVQLAKEKGACKKFSDTTYSQGILPIDTYKAYLDEVCSEPLHLDWESLRDDIKQYGMRNSTLSALMPSETSSQISNATNGIEPPRGHVSVKSSKDGVLKQVVPDIRNLADKYELLWDMPNNDGYLQLVGIMQKFIDQTISANTNYDPSKFENGKVPMKVIMRDLLTAYKLGVKTLYYHNTRDGADGKDVAVKSEMVEVVEAEDEDCAGGSCKI